MGTNTKFPYLEHFPTHFFSALVSEWSGQTISVNLIPNGLLSPDNVEKTVKLAQSISSSRHKQLQKLSKILEVSDIWWKAFHIPKIKPVSHLLQIEKTQLNVEKYTPKDSAKIKGHLIIYELSEHAILIVVEFLSRSKLLRRVFRHIYFPSAKIVLIEPQDQAIEILKNEILPFITQNPEMFSQKRANALLIKKLTKTPDDDRPPLIFTSIKIKISLETSGIEGLNQITIQGSNVIRGAETLEQRHEVSLKFMNSGPWVGLGTEDFNFEVGRGIQILRLEKTSLKSLASALTVI